MMTELRKGLIVLVVVGLVVLAPWFIPLLLNILFGALRVVVFAILALFYGNNSTALPG